MRTGQAAPLDVGPGTTPDATHRRTYSGLLVLLAATGVLATVVWQVARDTLVDDAYIYLSYARTLAETGEWGMIPGLPSNTATSALFVLLLGGLTVLVRDALVAEGVLFVGVFVLSAWGLWLLGRSLGVDRVFAWIGLGLLLLNPLIMSSTGLETQVGLMLIIWAAYAASDRRAVLFGLLSGALFLTRADLVVYAVVLLALTPSLYRRAQVALAAAAAITVPWLAFSWLVLGSAVPDTLIIKQGDSWGRWSFDNGLQLYSSAYPFAMLPSLMAPVLGVLAAVSLGLATPSLAERGLRVAPLTALGVGAAAYGVLYNVLGVAPFHWYYATIIGALSIVFAGGLAAAVQTRDSRRAARGVAAVVASVPMIMGAVVLGRVQMSDTSGSAAITTNWASPEQYKAMATDIAALAGGEVVRSPGEIGTLAYFCECTIVDIFSDRGVIAERVSDRQESGSAIIRLLLGINFATLDKEQRPLEPTLLIERHEGPLPSDVGADPTVHGAWPAYSLWTRDRHFVLTDS